MEDINPKDVQQFRELMAECWIVGMLLGTLPLAQLEDLASRAESTGPVLYPTIWRNNAKAIVEDRELIRILNRARLDLIASPARNLEELAPFLASSAEALQNTLNGAFRELFSRREFANISPGIIMLALVRYIAKLTPRINV